MRANPHMFYAIAAAAIVYEAIAVYDEEEGNTITEMIQELIKKPVVNFSCGFICGHLFG